MGSICTCCFKPRKIYESGSMQYEDGASETTELATFGAGCYWGTENWYVQKFDYREGLIGYAVGFMSQDPNAVKNPTYNQVCSGMTGHVEVFHMRFDSTK